MCMVQYTLAALEWLQQATQMSTQYDCTTRELQRNRDEEMHALGVGGNRRGIKKETTSRREKALETEELVWVQQHRDGAVPQLKQAKKSRPGFDIHPRCTDILNINICLIMLKRILIFCQYHQILIFRILIFLGDCSNKYS